MTDIVEQLRLLGDRASYEPHMHHKAADEIERLRRERDEAMGIVAVIYRDGGHRAAEVGNAQAIAEAHVKWGDLIRERDELLIHVEHLREKIDADRSCACSYDTIHDVCLSHSPKLAKAEADLAKTEALAVRMERERDEARAKIKAVLDALAAAQKPLDPEFQAAIFANIEALYEN